jgi:hypothetical protein
MKRILPALLFSVAFNCNAQNGLSNMSFETWTTTVIGTVPVGWFSSQVTQKTSGAQHGTSYAQFKNAAGSPASMFLTSSPTGFSAGAPYTQQPASISGFYKSAGMTANDYCSVYAVTFKSQTVSAVASFTASGNVGAWTSFNAPFVSLTGIGNDTLHIIMSIPSQGSGTTTPGATMDIDNLQLNNVVAIDKRSAGTSFLAFPNPASDVFNIQSMDENASSLIVRTVDGKMILKQDIPGEAIHLSIGSFDEGIYFYEIVDKSDCVLFRSRLVIAR